MNLYRQFSGTGVAVVTPFKNDSSIDFAALTKVLEHIIRGKCEYVVIMGTTGEAATLNKTEKAAVLRHAVETVKGRVPVVFGIGGNNTAEIVHELETAYLVGVDAILSVSPYYTKPNAGGIYHHYKAIAEASPLPVILYNVPGRTASNMTAEVTLRIAHDFPNIIGTKEASGNLEQIMNIIRDRPKNFLVISGDDLLTLPIIAAGGDGVISVVANACPRDYSDMVRYSLKGNFAAARPLHYKLTKLTQLLFADGSPGGVKVALESLKLCKANLRQPLWPVNETVRKGILAEMKKLR